MSAAHIIADDAEALAVAAEPAADFRQGATGRDAQRRLPRAELERLSASGLFAAAVRSLDAARGDLTDDSAADASIAVAAAKVMAGEAAVEVGSALFEVSGTRSALGSLGLYRRWRDARTHPLHDPARWEVQHIGRYVLNGTRPPRHGLV
ncbi:acyl-CoA dehydrogenase family protein [Streptomyces sp. NPDC005017]|uniref:acyl-CoA dehydrogenase family protein n=1 Tax=Streptomyces sp. NPDC005017 TaxID=3364706 RepID=UPI00367FB7D1